MTDDKYEDVEEMKLPEIKITVLGNCGHEHASFEEWQQCKDCDSVVALSNKTGTWSADVLVSHGNAMWNAAIEAAAKIADDGDEYSADQIRKLKK